MHLSLNGSRRHLEHTRFGTVGLMISQDKETTMADESKKRGLTETDLASERMGKNKLQGDDQANVRNERQAVPNVKTETDSLIESFEKLDKDHRAREDLGKGNRSSGPRQGS